jgi:hypothetical protein
MIHVHACLHLMSLGHPHVPHTAHGATREPEPEERLEGSRTIAMGRLEDCRDAIKRGLNAKGTFEPSPRRETSCAADGDGCHRRRRLFPVTGFWDSAGQQDVRLDLLEFDPARQRMLAALDCELPEQAMPALAMGRIDTVTHCGRTEPVRVLAKP